MSALICTHAENTFCYTILNDMCHADITFFILQFVHQSFYHSIHFSRFFFYLLFIFFMINRELISLVCQFRLKKIGALFRNNM